MIAIIQNWPAAPIALLTLVGAAVFAVSMAERE